MIGSPELIAAAEAAGIHAFGHPEPEMISGPFSTEVWVARIAGLQAHLRIIADDVRGCDSIHLQRIGKQAQAGIVEADRYLAEPDWDHCADSERAA